MIFVYIIIAILLVIFVLALMAPKEFQVEKEIIINRSVKDVFDKLVKVKEQNEWSVWGRMDPNMKMTYTGEDSTVGFVSAWVGNKQVGSGSQTITKITPNERLDIDVHFLKPMENKSPIYFITEDKGESTLVKWGISGKMPIPFNIMGLFMNMDKAIGKDLIGGLTNLKELLEKN